MPTAAGACGTLTRFAPGIMIMLEGLIVATSPRMASANPLADPIPGNIPIGPFTVELADVISPIAFATDAEVPVDGSNRIFVTLREGKVVIVDNGTLLQTPFMDISAATAMNAGSAMSAMAFHPEFAEAGAAGEGLLYTVSQEAPDSGTAHFSGTSGAPIHQSVVYEWRVDTNDANRVDLGSKREILRLGTQDRCGRHRWQRPL